MIVRVRILMLLLQRLSYDVLDHAHAHSLSCR